MWLERHLHPDGLHCPRCTSTARRLFRAQGHFPAYRGRACHGYYTLLTGTVFEKTRQRPATLVLRLRGVATGEPTARLARELRLCHKITFTCAAVVLGGGHGARTDQTALCRACSIAGRAAPLARCGGQGSGTWIRRHRSRVPSHRGFPPPDHGRVQRPPGSGAESTPGWRLLAAAAILGEDARAGSKLMRRFARTWQGS